MNINMKNDFLPKANTFMKEGDSKLKGIFLFLK